MYISIEENFLKILPHKLVSHLTHILNYRIFTQGRGVLKEFLLLQKAIVLKRLRVTDLTIFWIEFKFGTHILGHHHTSCVDFGEFSTYSFLLLIC